MSERSTVETRLIRFIQSLQANASAKFTIEVEKRRIDEIITSLKPRHDFTTKEVGIALSTLFCLPDLCAMDSNMPIRIQSTIYRREVAQHLSGKGYAGLFLKIAASLQSYITAEKFDAYCQPVYNLSVLFSGFLNYCDKSSKLADEFGENGGVDLMVQFVNILDSLDNLDQSGTELSSAHRTKLELLSGVMGILHNCTRHTTNNRHMYRKANVAAMFESKTRSPDVNMRIKSILLLAQIADEKLTERVAPHLDCILLLVELLRRAVLSRNHSISVISESSSGSQFSAQELANALSHLAVNDDNKLAIQKCEGIPIIMYMLQKDFGEDEALEAFALIWQLLFVDSIRQDEVIRDIGDIFQILMRSKNYMIREMATYIAWTLSDYQMSFPIFVTDPTVEKPPFYLTAPPSETARAVGSCIMISCQQDSQMRAIYIKDKLLQGGYNVWMNEYPLRERIVAEKATVVQQSAIVLICVDEKYKESPSCRSEATYAKKLRKPLIPLLMDAEYQPDGWLEKLLGNDAKYHRFCSDEDMDTSIDGLIEDLGDRGKLGPVRALGNSDSSGSKLSANQEDAFRVASERNVRYWSSKRVQVWLKQNNLQKVHIPPEMCQGNQLLQMYGHYQKTPEKLKNALKFDFQLDDSTVLKFIAALCKLCS